MKDHIPVRAREMSQKLDDQNQHQLQRRLRIPARKLPRTMSSARHHDYEPVACLWRLLVLECECGTGLVH